MSLEDKVYTWKEGYLDTGEFFKKEDVQESIKELKEDLEKINNGIMSASQWMVIKRTRELIDKVFGVRLTKQESKK